MPMCCSAQSITCRLHTPITPTDRSQPMLNQVADPALDLVLEREIPIAPAEVFRAWTDPERLKPWFCPKPWLTTEAEIDLRPGGIFRTVMRGPAGEVADNAGCILEVVPNRKFAWTGALKPGY